MSTDLARFRDHCRSMAQAPDVTDDERALWLQMADEVDTYLDPHPVLFELEEAAE